MLNVLRVLSWAAVALAAVGVVVLGLLWNCGEGEIRDFLRQPGVVERFGADDVDETDDNPLSPLVLTAIEMGLRLNRPEIPILKIDIKDDHVEVATADEKHNIIPPPPPLPPFKFRLVGTVVVKECPERSLALIEKSNGQLEWVYAGQRLGRHRLGEIHPGRTVVTGGAETTELVMPPKPDVPKLLKGGVHSNI